MANDWIKMRANLHTHPKVVRIMSALKADRLRVVGALHAVWCLFDEHSSDGELEGYTPDTLDIFLGWPGFCEAMIAIGWLSDAGGSLVTPSFDEHNGQSAKRRAQESERKRIDRKMSAPDADKKRTREEKRREEKRREETTTNTAPAEPLPDLFAGVDQQVVADFKALRVKKRAPITRTAIDAIVREAAKAGLSLEGALRVCCARGWQGFEAEWVLKDRSTVGASPGQSHLGKAGQATAANAQRLLEEDANAT